MQVCFLPANPPQKNTNCYDRAELIQKADKSIINYTSLCKLEVFTAHPQNTSYEVKQHLQHLRWMKLHLCFMNLVKKRYWSLWLDSRKVLGVGPWGAITTPEGDISIRSISCTVVRYTSVSWPVQLLDMDLEQCSESKEPLQIIFRLKEIKERPSYATLQTFKAGVE